MQIELFPVPLLPCLARQMGRELIAGARRRYGKRYKVSSPYGGDKKGYTCSILLVNARRKHDHCIIYQCLEQIPSCSLSYES